MKRGKIEKEREKKREEKKEKKKGFRNEDEQEIYVQL